MYFFTRKRGPSRRPHHSGKCTPTRNGTRERGEGGGKSTICLKDWNMTHIISPRTKLDSRISFLETVLHFTELNALPHGFLHTPNLTKRCFFFLEGVTRAAAETMGHTSPLQNTRLRDCCYRAGMAWCYLGLYSVRNT